MKGVAYCGAINELAGMGILSGVGRVAGTSAGAITAVLLAVGYGPKELMKIITETNFADFADDSDGWFVDAERIFTGFGWFKGDYFRKWIGGLVKSKKEREDITFRELRESDNSLELYLIATNLSEQSSQIFSHEHTPDVEIREAARMSMSIPVYFECVRYGEDRQVMVDGGVTWNYPLNIFDNEAYLDNSDNGESVKYNRSRSYVFNHETLGFRLDSTKEIKFNRRDWANAPKGIRNIFDYAKALGEFMLETANKEHLHENDWNRTVFIDTLDVKTTDFNLPKGKIQDLIEQGRKGVRKHFEWRDEHENYKNKPA